MLIYNCKLSLLGKRQPLYTTNDDNAYTMYFILPKIMVSIPVCLLTSQSSCYLFPILLTCVLYFQNSHLTFPVINTVVNNITICVASLIDGDLMPDKGSSK